MAGFFVRGRSNTPARFTPPGALPRDIFPDSRNRMPLVTRNELNELGQKIYDQAASDPRLIARLHGPAGLRLRAPRLSELARPVNGYLRFEAGLDRRLAELAILASARETDQHFEWNAHEDVALREGLEPEIIDAIRLRKPLTGLGEKEATLIALARESIGDHEVGPETFAAGLRLFGAEQLILYVTLMGEYAAGGFLMHVFAQQLPDGQTSKLPIL